MASEYDSLLEEAPQSSEYDALLAPEPEASPGIGEIVGRAGQAALDVGKGLAQSVFHVPKPTELAALALGPIGVATHGIIEQVKGVPETIHQVQEAEQTPAYSPERFAAGANVASQLAMIALGEPVVKGFRALRGKVGVPKTLTEVVKGVEEPIAPEVAPVEPAPMPAVEPVKVEPVAAEPIAQPVPEAVGEPVLGKQEPVVPTTAAGTGVTKPRIHEMSNEQYGAEINTPQVWDSLYRYGESKTKHPFFATDIMSSDIHGTTGQHTAVHGVQFDNPLVASSRYEASEKLLGKNIYSGKKVQHGVSPEAKAILEADDVIGNAAEKAGYDAIVTPTEIQVIDKSKLPPTESVHFDEKNGYYTDAKGGVIYEGIGLDRAKERASSAPSTVETTTAQPLPETIKPTEEVIPSAIEEGKIGESVQAERPGDGEGGTPAEAGGGGGVQPEAEVVTPKEWEIAPVPPEQIPVAQKPSKIGQSIEAKAVEAKLTKGFAETAGYDPVTIADQSQRATDLIKASVPQARAIIRGEAPLPEGLRGTSVITAMEEHLLKNPDARVAYELANSPLTSATSAAAQEMRLMRERVPDSLAAKFQEIREARQAGAKLRGEAPETVYTDITKEVMKQASKRPTWEAFVREIVC